MSRTTSSKRPIHGAPTWLVLSGVLVILIGSCSDGMRPGPLPEPEYAVVDLWAAWSPRDSFIAYSRVIPSSAGPPGIYAIRPDGTDNRLLLEVVASNLRFSPDGSLLGMTMLGDIYIYDIDSDSLRQLTTAEEHEASIDWSPDGSSIVTWGPFVSHGGLRIVDASTGSVRPLTHGASPIWGQYPRWPPAGEWIAFAASSNDGKRDVFVVSPDGTSMRRLTDSAGKHGRADAPRWLCNGSQVLYAWHQLSRGPTGSRIVEINGLADAPWPVPVCFFDALSPDCQLVVTTAVQPGDDQLSGVPAGVLFVREFDDADGSTLRQLTSYSSPEGS